MKLKTPKDVLDEARGVTSTCSPAEAAARIAAHPDTLLLDVREPTEHEAQSIPGAHLIPRGLLEFQIQGVCAEAERSILVHCASGARALCAARTLSEMGYAEVTAIDGSFADLAAEVAGTANFRS